LSVLKNLHFERKLTPYQRAVYIEARAELENDIIENVDAVKLRLAAIKK
jgi:hypothetical protein